MSAAAAMDVVLTVPKPVSAANADRNEIVRMIDRMVQPPSFVNVQPSFWSCGTLGAKSSIQILVTIPPAGVETKF